VDLLIKRGAKVDKEMTDGRGPLILAFELQNMIIVDMLLSADTNVNFSNYHGVFYDLARQYQRTDRSMSRDNM
jgi:ankyrin repeat protein